MLLRALNEIVGKNILRHSVILKESLMAVEVIVESFSYSNRFLFIYIESRLERLAQTEPLNLLLWMGSSFYWFRMSSQNRWKLFCALIVVSVVLGVVGWQQFAPRPTSPTTMTITPSTTKVTAARTEWITISQVKSINYYLSLLESNSTQPYVRLASELRILPDLTNATAVAKITYLALNATNPEVREAFSLMMKGGTPDQGDFKFYSAPRYNTELQVLYWLACQNELKKDDTLALAIAMVNGLWVTMGDDEVRQAVYKDVNSVLNFGRQVSQWQRAAALSYNLEDYPLEAKICWVWTGNVTPIFGPFGLSDNTNSQNFLVKRLPLEGYLWNTVSVETLTKMRSLVETTGAMLSGQRMLTEDVGKTIHNLEYYFYFMHPKGSSSEHWDYADPNYPGSVKTIELDGKPVENWFIFNIDAMFEQQYLKTGKLTGGCMDETAWVDAWGKSVGISTTALWHVGWNEKKVFNRFNHAFNIFYDPATSAWKADDLHLVIGLGETYQLTHLFRPPVDQRDYIRTKFYDASKPPPWMGLTGNFFHDRYDLSEEQIRGMLLPGVPASQMKQWLLYS